MRGQANEEDIDSADLPALLYATLSNPDAWTAFLETAAALFGARGAQIIHQDMRDFNLSFTQVSGYDWSEEAYEAYAELIPEDPRLDILLKYPGQAVHCRMEMTDAEYRSTRIYREVLRDLGVEYVCGVNFGEDRACLAGMFLLRDQSQPPFTADDCERLQPLVPHIRRVLDLHGFIGRLELQNRITHDTLDSLGAGVIVIDASGMIEIANSAARTLLKAGGDLRETGGKLHVRTRDGETLKDMLQQVWSSHSMHPYEVLREGGDPLLVFMAPHAISHGRFDPQPLQEGGAVMVVRAPDLRQDPASQARMVELLWNLPPSQARLACLIGAGETLSAAAEQMGVTEASARQYLKAVFRKLGVNRQSDLLRKVTSVLVSARPH